MLKHKIALVLLLLALMFNVVSAQFSPSGNYFWENFGQAQNQGYGVDFSSLQKASITLGMFLSVFQYELMLFGISGFVAYLCYEFLRKSFGTNARNISIIIGFLCFVMFYSFLPAISGVVYSVFIYLMIGGFLFLTWKAYKTFGEKTGGIYLMLLGVLVLWPLGSFIEGFAPGLGLILVLLGIGCLVMGILGAIGQIPKAFGGTGFNLRGGRGGREEELEEEGGGEESGGEEGELPFDERTRRINKLIKETFKADDSIAKSVLKDTKELLEGIKRITGKS